MLRFEKLLDKWKISKDIKEAENPVKYNPCQEYIGLINKFFIDKKMSKKEKDVLNKHLASCKECSMFTYKTKVNMPHIPKKIPKALEEHIKKINRKLFKKYKKESKNK